MYTENVPTLKIHRLTQEQYDREVEAGTIDKHALYLTPDTDVKYATELAYYWDAPTGNVDPYILNLALKNVNGEILSTVRIDLPLEQMVLNAEYDEESNSLILKTPNGDIEIPLSSIFKGIITESNIKEQSVKHADSAYSYLKSDGTYASMQSLENLVKSVQAPTIEVLKIDTDTPTKHKIVLKQIDTEGNVVEKEFYVSDGETITGIEFVETSTENGGETKFKFKRSDGETIPDVVTIRNGSKGDTPYILDGYWYVSGASTGVKAQGEPGIGMPGYSPTVQVTPSAVVDGKVGTKVKISYLDADERVQYSEFFIPDGDKGDPGLSPRVGIEQLEDGWGVSFTDAYGTHSYEVYNGEKGDKGDKGDRGDPGRNGVDGVDGHTPTDSEIKSLISKYLNETYFTKGY